MFWTIVLTATAGMRTLTAIAVLCWAAYIGWLPVQGTWAFWMAKLVTVIVFTVLALGEYVGDTLPGMPNRTDPPLVAARLFFGVVVGMVVATVLGQPKAGGFILGVIGALIGTYGGYRVRMLGTRLAGRDRWVALSESVLALGLSVIAVSDIHQEILVYADKAASLLQPR